MQNQVIVKHIKSKSFHESESFKKLRTNIQFSGKNIKAIAFTSTFPGEGKSEIAYRVAYSLAVMGKKTILVDSDLRNSTLVGRVIEGEQTEFKGLVHYLVDECTIDEIVLKTQNPNFDLIPIGAFPPNPSELLVQEGFKELIAELKNRYDYVIIDTPPAGYVIDGVVSSSVSDGVIYVVASGQVSVKVAKNTVTQLKNAGCKVIGCVLNKCGKDNGNHYENSYYSYGYGYTKNYVKGKKKRRLKKFFLKKQ